MKQIVVVTDSADPSGMGAHMLTLATALKADFDMVIAAPAGEAGVRLLAQGAAIGLQVKSFELDRLDQFRHWLEAFGADLVHVHAGIGWEGHGLVRAARSVGVPVVRTEHLPYLITDVVQAAKYRAMLLSVDQRIAVSSTVAQSHAGKGSGAISVVRNGISPALPAQDRETTRSELGVDKNTRLVLTVARFTAQKGYDLLVQAVPAVLEAHPDTTFAFVGAGPEQQVIPDLIHDGLGSRIKILGQRDDIASLLAAADVFVLPSHFEGLSLALLEAASAGLPIVATATGGNIEVLGDAHALLVPPGQPEALAAGICEALGNSELASKSAQSTRERFAKNFTAERMGAETAKIYQSVLSRSAPQGTHA